MLEIKEIQPLIIEWAKEKNITNPDRQYLKILEEVGETSRAILHNDIAEIKDGIGDIAVTVIIYYWQIQQDLQINLMETSERLEDWFYLDRLIRDLHYRSGNALYHLYDLAIIHNTTLKECLNLAWNEIKDRKGKTVNGTFIKNE